MSFVKSVSRCAVVLALSLVSSAIGFFGNSASAAPERLDVNGNLAGSGITAAGSPYSWEAAGYSSTSAGTDPVPWVEGNFLRLAAGTDAGATNYTLTANSSHTVAGMFLQSNGGGTVTINGASGVVLTIPNAAGSPNVQGFLVNSSTQKLIINATLGGTGGIQNQLSGSLNLYGNNTYSGGTLLGTVAGLNFNNNNSFGTGAITWGVASQVLADPDATSPINIGNAMITRAASTLILTGPAVAPATYSGPWTLAAGTSTITAGSGAFPNTVATISGAMSGAGANLVKNGTGTLVISSTSNTYNGSTTVSAGRLQLGAANTIASTSSLVLNGGTLDPDGLNQIMSATTLGLLANSSIDFGVGASEVDLASSSAVPWTAGSVLNLASWDFSTTKLRFGTGNSGLTAAQLAQIQFNGSGLGTAMLDANGYVTVVPEPASVLLVSIGVLAAWPYRRRAV
jgi:autotransporter-associated beta strand protein